MIVGVTFFVRQGEGSIWTNGGIQHTAFLCQLLARCPCVEQVIAIHGGDGDEIPPLLLALGLEWQRLEAVIDKLDVLIEAGAQVSAAEVDRIHRNGGKAISFKYGNAFVIDAERIIHNKESGSIFNGSRFDAVWTNPQHVHTCARYWETLYRCPVHVVPHIWDPTFVEAVKLPDGLNFRYQHRPGPKRIAVLEPNINIIKTCIIPMLIIEQVYRQKSDLVGDIYITNALKVKEHLTFQSLAKSLDMVKDGLCSFEARFNTPWFVAKYVDVVVCHQWENSANYLIYDLLYGGYPVVHNYPDLPAGYYYEGFDVVEGSKTLLDALEGHDRSTYNEQAAEFLRGLRTWHPDNIVAHNEALMAA